MSNDDKKGVKLPAKSIKTLFADVMDQTRDVLEKQPPDSFVDLELTFQSVNVDQKGFLIFSKKSESSTIQIRLATRITC